MTSPCRAILALLLLLVTTAVHAEDKKLNLNTAAKEQLVAVGLSESQALQVIGHREKSGPLLQVEELTAVPQMTKDAFNRIHDRVTVDE
jgi:competence ComEA-like helix-hairpin-helix protein